MAWSFDRSSALFDRETRLLEWDRGFAEEFQLAAPILRHGLSYGELLGYLYENHPEIDAVYAAQHSPDELRRRREVRLASFGGENSFDYLDPAGRLIHVDERVTPSGGVLRIAAPVSTPALQSGEPAPSRRNHRIEITEADVWVRRAPDGTLSYAPPTEELALLLGNAPWEKLPDPMAAYSRIEQTPQEIVAAGAAFEESRRTLSIFSLTVRTRTYAGRRKWLSVTATPTTLADGSTLWSGVMRDITREKEASDELDLLRSAVIHANDAIVIFETTPAPDSKTGARTSLLYANAAYERLILGSATDLAGEFADRAAEFADSATFDLLRRALRSGSKESLEFSITRRDGAEIWVEGRLAILQQATDDDYRWVMVAHDITDRRNHEAELVTAKEAAEAGNRTKSQFLANMSHELRTPLNAIIGFSEVIRDETFGPVGNPRYREYANDIHRSGQHLLEIINDVLEMSKIEAKRMELHDGVVDLRTIIDSVIRFTQHQALEAGIAIVADLPEMLPPIRADELRIRQILLNLISNAIKFSYAAGRVELGAARLNDGGLSIWIRDEGIGMNDEQIAIAMQPFRQVSDALSRTYNGTGLGLPIANELVKLHNGTLTLASRPQGGTTAMVTLPADRILPLDNLPTPGPPPRAVA